VTPPFWGEAMKQHFPNSSHLVAPNTGHNVAPVGCTKDIIADFINTASYEELDVSCLDDIKRPSFFLNTSGPVRSTEE
ncbi:MAG: alpha/beta hydrolase, partial [Enterobacterales bacterium]|nr:alpha/beta hydrolase [Enterobacterales bacterium]